MKLGYGYLRGVQGDNLTECHEHWYQRDIIEEMSTGAGKHLLVKKIPKYFVILGFFCNNNKK